MTIKYEAKCSTCGRIYPVLLTDPSKAPVCHGKMDVTAVDTKDWEDEVVESLGFYADMKKKKNS